VTQVREPLIKERSLSVVSLD